MFAFSCMLFVLLEIIVSLRVSCNLHKTIHDMTENHNNAELRTLKNMWKSYDGKQNLAPSSVRRPTFSMKTYHAQHSSNDASDKKSSLFTENDNYILNSNKINLKLNTNNIVNSKRRDLLKNKRELINHAKDLKQNLHLLHNEQILSPDNIKKIKYDMFHNLDFGKSSAKVLQKRTPLARLQFVNDSSTKNSNRLHGISHKLSLIDEETRASNSSIVYNSPIQEHPLNCTKENNWCHSLETHVNKRTYSNKFDSQILHAFGNDTANNSLSKLGTALADKGLYYNYSEKSPDVVKERGMQDKFFNFGNSEQTNKYGMGEKKKGPLKAITDKLKYVFPFLKGFGLGVQKELKKPKPKSPNPHHTFKYDPELGMFYTLSQTAKLPVYPSPVLMGSKRPIFLSDLLKSNTKTKLKGIPVPYNVEVEKRIPYFIKVPYDNPVPVHISEPYGVPVEKIVPYPVRVEVPDPYPVTKIVKKPYNLYVDNPVPVEVEQPYPVLKEQVKPYSVETVVNKPYLHPVYNDFAVALPYDKNILYPVTVDSTSEHQNTLNDELVHLNNETGVPSDSTGKQLTRNVPLFVAYNGVQKPPINQICNSSHLKPNSNLHKTPYYYYTDNRSPKTTKIKQSKVPITYAEALKAIMKIRGSGITEVKFLDLMKKRETMRQNQLLQQALQRTLLHRQQLLTLVKQNQMLKATLARDQNRANPIQPTKELYPEFKPLSTNVNLPILQNYMNNLKNVHKNQPNQDADHSNPEFGQKNHPEFGQKNHHNTYFDSHQNIAQHPKTQQEIIDEHLGQLYNNNKNNNVQVQGSESFSYRLPDGPSLSSYYNQGDSDSDYSMQKNIFRATPNVSLQENDLYRLQLEYKILDKLMKNINVIKNNSEQSVTTSGYDESLVTKFDPQNIQMIKFSHNESVPPVQSPFYNHKNPHNNLRETTKSNIQYAQDINFIQENSMREQTEKYNDPNSWANLNQHSQMDNYTRYLANVIRDSYHLKNHSSYGDNTDEEKIQTSEFENIDAFSSESTSAPISKPNSNNFQPTVNIGNKYKPNVSIKDMTLPSDSPSQFVDHKDHTNLIQGLFKNGLGTYKPIYNSDGKKSNNYNGNNHNSGSKVVAFPSEAVEFEVLSNEKQKTSTFGSKTPTKNYGFSELKVAQIPSKSIPFEVTGSENHKKTVAFGIDVTQDEYEKKTERPYDFEIGRDDELLYGDGSEDYISYESKTNAEPVETAKSRTEDDKYENYQGYYKKPLKKWIFNNTEEFKGNSAINFGKLNDFLDIVKQNQPQNESEAQKKVTVEKINNAIFSDVQKHFDTPKDMNAEGSYHIESKTRINEVHKENNNDLDFSDAVFKNMTKSELNVVNLKTKNSTIENDQPVRIALLSTNLPTTTESKVKEFETLKTRVPPKAQKNETSNGMQTTISEYSNIRRGKDIVSNKTTNVGEDKVILSQAKNNNIPNINSSSKTDSLSRKETNSKNSAKQTMKETYYKNDNESDGKVFEKLAIITPDNSSSVDHKFEEHTDHFQQNEPDLQIFDLFNTLDSFMSNKKNNSIKSEKEIYEKLNIDSTKITLPTVMSITTTSSLFTTLPDTLYTTSTKTKAVRGRGSIKASTSYSGKSENTNMRIKNIAIEMDETTIESIPNNKHRRRNEKNKPLSEEESTTVNSHIPLFKNNVKNDTKKLGTQMDGYVRIRNKTTETPGNNKSALYEDSKKLRKFNSTHKTYQKDTNEFRTVRIFPLDESTESVVTTSLSPAADRVTVKTVQQIERVKIKNQIKAKIENTTKKSFSKIYDYRNSSDILERRQKNRERFMFGFMITTPDTPIHSANN